MSPTERWYRLHRGVIGYGLFVGLVLVLGLVICL